MSMTIKTLKFENVEDDAGNITPVMTVQYRNRIETFPGIFETLLSPIQTLDPSNKAVFDQVLGLANTQLKLDADQARADADKTLALAATEKTRADTAEAAMEAKDAKMREASSLIANLQGHQVEQDAASSALEAERDELVKQLAAGNQAAHDAEEARQITAQQHETTVNSMQAQIDDMQRSTLEANEDAGRTRNVNAQLRIKIQAALNALQPYPDAHAALVAELEAIGIGNDAPASAEA